MPTGYTAAIEDGITFEQYAWACARNFGALITMRDSPSDAPIPERFEESAYYAESRDKAAAELAAFDAMSIEEKRLKHAEEERENVERNECYRREREALKAKYESMLAQVRGWTPPTSDHIEYKKFMESQIVQSIDFDCSELRAEPIPAFSAWCVKKRGSLVWSANYTQQAYEDEVKRVNGRNAWVQALRDSFAAKGGGDE